MVVLAVGAGKPYIPSPFPPKGHEGMSHILNLDERKVLPKRLQSKIAEGKPTAVVVIGGGLANAQLVNSLLRAGVDKVWLLMRGPWKGMGLIRSWMNVILN